MTTTDERNPYLDRLAAGVDCPRCRAWADTPCATRRTGAATAPHAERINRATDQYLRGKAALAAERAAK